MKKYSIYILLFAFAAFFTSCEEDFVVYDNITEMRNDPLMDLTVNTSVVSFVAGKADYTIEFLVRTPNSDAVKSIDVLKTYTDAGTGVTADPVLLKNYPVTQGANTTLITDVITYADLKAGIPGLPDAETDIPVGSSWVLTFVPIDGSGGEAFSTSAKINVSVLSPFAGIYRVIESDYYRIGAQSGAADWSGTDIFIGSVDANTFSHNDWWGPFDAAGFFVFDLNDDNTITIPDNLDQLFFSGDDMLTCQEDAGSFANVPCDGSNVLEIKADGKHIIKLTYGYFTASGDENEGAREFYEVLEKIN